MPGSPIAQEYVTPAKCKVHRCVLIQHNLCRKSVWDCHCDFLTDVCPKGDHGGRASWSETVENMQMFPFAGDIFVCLLACFTQLAIFLFVCLLVLNNVPLRCLPWGIQVAFPGESQL